MSKILKSFCCSVLFVALNLCGASAVDYVFFYVYKPYMCGCCGKKVSSTVDNWENANYYLCYRKIGSYDLMCEECKIDDHDQQIKELVLECFPKFKFEKPKPINSNGLLSLVKLFPVGCFSCEKNDFNNQQIKESVLQFFPDFNFDKPNLGDIKKLLGFFAFFPIDRFLCEKCDCCHKPIDLLSPLSYDICMCGAPVHVKCMEKSKHFLVCKTKDDNGEARRMKFISWYTNGCKLIEC